MIYSLRSQIRRLWKWLCMTIKGIFVFLELELYMHQLNDQKIFQFLILIQTAVYTAERFVIQWNFSDLKNPRFIIESGFKSRAGYNGARTVYIYSVDWWDEKKHSFILKYLYSIWLIILQVIYSVCLTPEFFLNLYFCSTNYL